MRKWMSLSCSLLLFVAGTGIGLAEGVVEQSMGVEGQTSTDCSTVPLPADGARPVIEGAFARLQRGPNGITGSVAMPTPAPGTYCYPPATLALDPAAGPAVPGHPEAWSLWAIYFNEPDDCSDGVCGVDDVLNPANCANAKGGAMPLGGHIVGGSWLNLAGHLSVGQGPLGPLGCAPLMDANSAEIHLAVAPHGLLMPHLMPALISTPPGGGPGYWFPAAFEVVD